MGFLSDLQHVLTDKNNIYTIEICSVIYFLFLAAMSSIACLFIAFPVLYENEEDYFRNLLYFSFLFINMIGNFLLGSSNPSTYTNGILLEYPPKSWILCLTCQQHCPPRSHHCPVCNVCVLKRDHHCYFFRTCVGVRNLRYFLPYSLYVGLGSIFCAKQMFSYLHSTYIPIEFSLYSFLSYAPPGIIYNLWNGEGNLDFVKIFCLFVLYGCLTTGFGSSFFFIMELFLVLVGQTAYESTKAIHRYNMGVVKNLRMVFGDWGILYFLIPLPVPTKEINAPWGYPKFIKGV